MIRVELRSWSRYGTLFNWTNIGVSFVLLTVNLFRHPTLIEHGLYKLVVYLAIVDKVLRHSHAWLARQYV